MTDLLKRASNYLKHRKENQVETNSFKNNHSFLKRKEESDRILAKYPDRVPVICERITKRINQLDRKKYLCPGDLSLGNFMYVIRKRMKLSPEKAIYLFVNESHGFQRTLKELFGLSENASTSLLLATIEANISDFNDDSDEAS